MTAVLLDTIPFLLQSWTAEEEKEYKGFGNYEALERHYLALGLKPDNPLARARYIVEVLYDRAGIEDIPAFVNVSRARALRQLEGDVFDCYKNAEFGFMFPCALAVFKGCVKAFEGSVNDLRGLDANKSILRLGDILAEQLRLPPISSAVRDYIDHLVTVVISSDEVLPDLSRMPSEVVERMNALHPDGLHMVSTYMKGCAGLEEAVKAMPGSSEQFRERLGKACKYLRKVDRQMPLEGSFG